MASESNSFETGGLQFHRRRRAILLACVAAVLLVLGLVPWLSTSVSVPSHEGRPLSDILVGLHQISGVPQKSADEAALHALAPEALPYLVSRVASENWRVRLFRLVRGRLPQSLVSKLHSRLDIGRLMAIDTGARVAISMLGTNVAPAATELMHAYRELRFEKKATLAQVLPRVGPSIVQGLLPELVHPDVRTRSLAAFVVHQIGPAAAGAAPALIAGLEGADANHRELVAQTLARLGLEVAPLVDELLDDQRADRRMAGLRALHQLFPRLRETTPRLVALLDDPVGEVRLEAGLVLGGWWPMPLTHWLDKLAGRPVDDPVRVQLAAALAALEQGQTRLREVLWEELQQAPPEKRVAAARLLLDTGEPGQALIEELEKVIAAGSLPTPLQEQAVKLLERARLLLLNERS